MRVQADFKKLKPWLTEKKAIAFVICFAHYRIPQSKENIMIELDKMRFFTLSEIEKEIGEVVFTITN